MSVITLEGIVENGLVRLNTPLRLPDKTRVFVIVPSLEDRPLVRVFSPRLLHPEQVSDFIKEVIEVLPDASI